MNFRARCDPIDFTLKSDLDEYVLNWNFINCRRRGLNKVKLKLEKYLFVSNEPYVMFKNNNFENFTETNSVGCQFIHNKQKMSNKTSFNSTLTSIHFLKKNSNAETRSTTN